MDNVITWVEFVDGDVTNHMWHPQLARLQNNGVQIIRIVANSFDIESVQMIDTAYALVMST